MEVDSSDFSSTLPLIIKKYDFEGTLSKEIHEFKSTEFIVKGPFGLGLEVQENSKGNFVMFFILI